MRELILFFVVLTVVLSCDNHKTRQQQELPKALDEQKKSYSILSKRSHDDILEDIYSEVVDKNPELKKLEEDIDAINDSEDDSLEAFTKFDAKNNSYYSSAHTHAGQIKDSLLRDKMATLIQNSLSGFNSATALHKKILKSIESKEATLSDVHMALKIIKTLPVISKYQRSNAPATKSLEGYSQELSKTITKTQNLSNELIGALQND